MQKPNNFIIVLPTLPSRHSSGLILLRVLVVRSKRLEMLRIGLVALKEI
jgi:hypothetical protein